ncbi:MAG: flagellar motor switch protein FliM [Gammaproteobacteria bacterium]|nr:flagellar motor switch protein FliM [Gammaproteobacteria bacterium]
MAASGDRNVAAGAPNAPRERSTISEEEVSALLENPLPDAARPVDFAARRISRTSLPVLEAICRDCVEPTRTALAALLNRSLEASFTGLGRQSAADALAELPMPASVAVIRLKPLAGDAWVVVDPPLLLAMVDAFFGGSGRPSADPQAAVGPAAQRFLALAMGALGTGFATAFAQAAPIEIETVRLETNARSLRPADAHEPVLVARFGVEIGTASGEVRWLLPEAVFTPIREALAADGGKPATRPQAPWAPLLGAALQAADLEARAVLGEAQISIGALVRLAPGDVIPIDPPQHVVLLAGEVPLYRGRFGSSNGHNALKILSREPE